MIRKVLLASLFALACAADAREADTAEIAEESEVISPASLGDFEGAWEATSDDGTNIETAEIEVSDGGAVLCSGTDAGESGGRLALGLQPGRRTKAPGTSSSLRKTRRDARTRRKRAAKTCQCRVISTGGLNE